MKRLHCGLGCDPNLGGSYYAAPVTGISVFHCAGCKAHYNVKLIDESRAEIENSKRDVGLHSAGEK